MPEVHLTTKRRLLEAAGGITLMGFLGGGAAALAKKNEPLLRPPGSRPESELLATCLRCDRCRSVCPQNVIRSADLGDGLTVLRTPVLDFHAGFCDFCLKCIDVCPAGSLLPVEKEAAKVGLAELTDNCIALRTGACSKCVDYCPENAIHLSASKVPVIDAERCNGCGKCEALCPANVIQSYKGSVRGIVVKPLKKEAAS